MVCDKPVNNNPSTVDCSLKICDEIPMESPLVVDVNVTDLSQISYRRHGDCLHVAYFLLLSNFTEFVKCSYAIGTKQCCNDKLYFTMTW